MPAYKSRIWGCLHTLAKLSCFRWVFWSHPPDYNQPITILTTVHNRTLFHISNHQRAAMHSQYAHHCQKRTLPFSSYHLNLINLNNLTLSLIVFATSKALEWQTFFFVFITIQVSKANQFCDLNWLVVDYTEW